MWLFCEVDIITDLVSVDNFANVCEPLRGPFVGGSVVIYWECKPQTYQFELPILFFFHTCNTILKPISRPEGEKSEIAGHTYDF